MDLCFKDTKIFESDFRSHSHQIQCEIVGKLLELDQNFSDFQFVVACTIYMRKDVHSSPPWPRPPTRVRMKAASTNHKYMFMYKVQCGKR